ncbi:hypothetical protein ACG2LH_04750 [Zhouia sp. PK063]|uniref:hypothetical protein n=1 Tax=Zhouia sp. PK063 TaxID=3373602 RepID=UPI003799A310
MVLKKEYVGFLVLFLISTFSHAQCAMCRAVLETGENQHIGEGINHGIMYLMIIPYLLMGGLAYFIYKRLRNP